MRKLKIKICSKCKRRRPIYQVKKQLCTSCRTLDYLERNPRQYTRLLKRSRDSYKKDSSDKKIYNKKYYIQHAEHLKEYGRKYWREVASKK